MQTLIVPEGAALVAALRTGTSIDTRSKANVFTELFSETDCLAMLALLQKGWSCRAIAAAQGVSVPTVKARLMQLYRQIGRRKQPNWR